MTKLHTMKRLLPCLGLACLFAAAHAAEAILAQTKSDPPVQLRGNTASDNLSLSLKVGETTLPIQSEGFKSNAALHPDMPLQAQSGALGEVPALWVSFGMNDGAGSTRSFAIVFIQDATAWRAVKQWTADCAARGELGFTREKQSLAFDAASGFVRQLRVTQSEGVVHKLDCGCLTCDSRLSETIENEKWIWNAAAGKLERSSYERRYIVQSGENMLTVARKALGDARLLARIYKLNPDIKQESALQPGQKILVERQ